MTLFRRRIGSSLLAVCTALAAACSDSATAPVPEVTEGLSGSLSFADTIFTRGVPVRATFTPPAGYQVVPGSVTWSAPTGAATLLPVAGTNQADVTFTAAGAAQISATYRITRDGAASSLSAAAPTLRTSGVAQSTATRSVSVSAPTLAFAVKPSATATASATLGNVRVELRDARGRAVTTGSDSVSIKLDPASGTSGAMLLGTATAPAVSGVASFNNLAIRRVGTAYRLIASSATVQKSDTALVSITPGAPSAAASTLTLSRTNTAAGDTLTVSVTVRDEYGNIVLDATPAALAGTASGGVVGTFTCRAGVCTATYTAPLLAGTPTVSVTIGGANVGGSPATVTVNAGAPARFVIVGATSQVAGTAQTITIRAIDAFGNIAVGYTGAKSLSFSGALVAPIGTAPTVSSTPFGSGATITFVNGIATASMTLVGAGTNVVTATDGAVTTSGPDRLTVAVVHNVSSPAQTLVTLSPSSVAPGGSVTITVTIRDAWGNPVLNATPDLLKGTPGAGTLGAFTCVNGVCTAPYVAPNTAGPYPLPFTIGGQPLPPPTVTVVAGAPARLVITGNSTQVAGTTQPITLRALDAAGNVVTNYTGAKSLQFSGASSAPNGTPPDVAGLRFATATSVTFENGVATVALRLFAAETATISATDGTLTSVGADRLTVVVSAGAAARLAILGASTQPAGSTQSMLVVASDTWGNRATSYTGNKSLTFSGASIAGGSNVPAVGTTAFGTATSVPFVNGAAANVPMTLYAVETALIAATDGTISATGTSRLSVVVTAGAVSASTSTLALSASILTPGQQVTVTVTLRDASGNIVTSANAASFSGSVSGGMLGAWSCTNGVCTATYTAPTVAGGQTISAQIGGTDIVNSPAAVTVVPGAPARLVIIGAATQTAGASQNITIRAIDAYDNIATGYAGSKNLTFSGASVSLASNIPAVSSTAFGTTTSVTFTAGVATSVPMVLYKEETAVIATTDGSISATGDRRLSVTVTAAAASAAQSTLAVSPASVAPGGTATATVTVRDAFGNVITDATSAAFATSTSAGSLGAFSCTLGVCTATYTAPTLAGAKTISATIGGTNIGNSPATVTVTAGAAYRFVIFGDSTQVAGASQNITIRALDVSGNIAVGYTGSKNLTFSGANASPSGSNPTASATAFGTTTAVTFTAGEATGVPLVLFKAETAVVATTDGSVSATDADRLDVRVIAAAASAAQSTLGVSPTSVTVGGTATATVTVRDAFGNVITDATSAAFAPSTSAGSLGAFSCTLGVCTATYTAPALVGAKTISATIGSTNIGGSPATVTVTAGAAAYLQITGTGTQVAGASQNITITARDASNNVATSYTGAKTLTFSGASVSANGNAPKIVGTAFGTGTSVTFANGVATPVSMTLYAAETAVVATTDGSISAADLNRLTVIVSADNASPVVTDITAAPTSIVANGTSESTLSITLKDAYGNATANVASPGTVLLVKTAGTGTLLGSLANAGGGVYTQQVQSAASAGSGTFAATLNGTQTTNTATVTYQAAGGVLSRVVCTTSQPAGQSAASSATVNLCSNASAGDLELVTLALDGTDDLSAPATGGLDGTWVKIASQLQTTGSGGNKPMLLILYARRYAAGLNRVVTFTAGTNHKWSVDMVTLQSSGSALPTSADVSVANNATGSALSISTPFTAAADNTVLYHVFANSGTGATATITPSTSLTTLGTNNTGGTSSLSFLEILANAATAPTRSFTSSVNDNTVLLRLVVRP